MRNKLISWLVACCLAIWSVQSNAVSSQAGGTANFSPDQIKLFAKKVETTVAQHGARAFFIARVGRPPSELPKGIEYTHTGIGIYSAISLDDGRVVPGYAMYNLYQRDDDPSRSHLVQDYPVDFFAAVEELKAGVIIPIPEIQQRLISVVQSDTYRKLHNPRYSAISNPYDKRYQNCTEHTLDVLQSAIYSTDNIDTIKVNNQAYYTAQEVKINPFKLLFGALLMPDVTLLDQDEITRTATFLSLANYLRQHELLIQQLTITP